MYVEGDSPMALVWLFTSFIIAPLLSLAAVWLVARGQRLLGVLIATGAVVPNLLLFFGTYSFIPLHPAVLALTVVTLVCLALVLSRRAEVAQTSELVAAES